MTCHNCGSHKFDKGKSLLTGSVPAEIAHLVPIIVQCQDCKSTFSTASANLTTAEHFEREG